MLSDRWFAGLLSCSVLPCPSADCAFSVHRRLQFCCGPVPLVSQCISGLSARLGVCPVFCSAYSPHPPCRAFLVPWWPRDASAPPEHSSRSVHPTRLLLECSERCDTRGHRTYTLQSHCTFVSSVPTTSNFSLAGILTTSPFPGTWCFLPVSAHLAEAGVWSGTAGVQPREGECILPCPPGWTMDCFQEWGLYIRLAVPSMFMLCIEWWTFEIGTFLAGLSAARWKPGCSLAARLRSSPGNPRLAAPRSAPQARGRFQHRCKPSPSHECIQAG